VSARKHNKFEIDSFCPSLCSRAGEIFAFSQVIDTKASNHCKKNINFSCSVICWRVKNYLFSCRHYVFILYLP